MELALISKLIPGHRQNRKFEWVLLKAFVFCHCSICWKCQHTGSDACAEVDHILRLASWSTGDETARNETLLGLEPLFGPQHMLYRIAFHGVAFNRGLISVQRMVEVQVLPIVKLALQANQDVRCPRESDDAVYVPAYESLPVTLSSA